MNGSRSNWMAHSKLNGSRREWNPGLRSRRCRFSRASTNMAARTPGSGRVEVNERDNRGGGDPQQILRSCAESLLTAVARLEEGERHRTQTSVARSSTSPAGTSAIDIIHPPYQMIPNRKWSRDRKWSLKWTANDPRPQVIPKVDRKWSRKKNRNGLDSS